MSSATGAHGQDDATEKHTMNEMDKTDGGWADADSGHGAPVTADDHADDGVPEGSEASGSGAFGVSTDQSLSAHAKARSGGQDGSSGSGGARRWLWILIAVIVVVALVGALVVARLRHGSRSGEASRPASSIAIGLKLAPANLDIRNQSGSALDQALVGNVYEGLVSRDQNNKVIPGLAKSWNISADGLTYTFHLRDDAMFSNGDRLDAEDAAWSINELKAKDYHDAEALQNFKSARALDARTVAVTLSAPYSQTLWAFAGRPGLVFDRKAKVDMKTQALGSGPYAVSKFVPNSSLTLTANPQYKGAHKAKTKTVILRYYTDDNAAVNALKSGDVQALAPITENLAAPFANDRRHYTVKVGEGTDKYVLAMNSKGQKTSDVRVRKAIRLAIDHKALIASRGGADKLMGGPIPSLDPGYEDLSGKVAKPDVAQAKSLLEQAGYSTSHPLQLRLEYANTYGTELGDQLRSQLKQVGIDLKVNVVEFSTWMQDVYMNKDYDLSLVDHSESHDFSQWVNTGYYYNYDNAKVRSLYAQAMAAHSDADRDKLLAQAARLVSDDAPADWLFNYRITTATANGLSGFPLNLNQTLLPVWALTYTAVR